MSRTAVLLSLSALLLAGCASRNTCVGDTEYQQATSLPPPATVDGLKMPESASALRIPPPPAASKPQGENVCLHTPPPIAEGALGQKSDQAVQPVEHPKPKPDIKPKDKKPGVSGF